MNRTRHKRAALLSCGTALLLLLILVALTAFALNRQQRQDRLNRALIAAVKASNTNAALSLLKQGASANARDEVLPAVPFWTRIIALIRGTKPKPSTASTPLLLATENWNCDPRLIQALLENKADPSCRDAMNISCLDWAIMDRKTAVVHLLLTHGADVNAKDPGRGNMLSMAILQFRGAPGVLQDLLDHGENVNERDPSYGSALGCAVMFQRVAAVKLLLAHHADVTIRAWQRITPLALARQESETPEMQEIVRLLKAAGAREQPDAPMVP